MDFDTVIKKNTLAVNSQMIKKTPEENMEYDILNKKYPNNKFVKLEGGYTNTVFFIDGSNPQVIVKIYRKGNIDAKIEFNALSYMNNSNVSPKVYEYFEDNFNIYVIMEYIQGINGQKYMDNCDFEKTEEIYNLLGLFLAKNVHSIKQEENIENIPLKSLGNLNLDFLNIFSLNIINKIKDIFNVKVKEENVLTHGDYGPHNTLVYNNGLKIIDWEWACWGNPLFDVAWVIWFVHLHYPNVCKKLSKIFLKEYCSNNKIEIDEDIIRAFSMYKVIKLLEKAITISEDAKCEWVRRLEWTIETDFNI